jgi:predicted exporter
MNGGYNIFNLVALMLVFGIGLDMGIFLQESRGGVHTWLAVSLSTLTSLLAFGLLALSQTPVLYHFGIIVLPGLLVIWLLSPLMQTSQLETR